MHRSKREIEQLLAERFPKSDVAASITPVIAAGAETMAAPGSNALRLEPPSKPDSSGIPYSDPITQPVGNQGPQLSPGTVAHAAIPCASAPCATSPKVAPLAPARYAIQFTASGPTHEHIKRLEALLGRRVGSNELDEALAIGLEALSAKIEKSRFAATSRSKARKATRAAASNPRYIPAEIKRQVRARDGDRCTFVAPNGRRCGARGRLEFDHVIPVAKGGKSEPGNLRLLCRAHNQYEASQALGEGFMHEIRARASRGSQATAAAP